MTIKAFEQPIESRNLYRFAVLTLAILIGLSTLGARMFYMQLIYKPDQVQSAATPDSEVELIPSTRGLIYDAAGNQLVKNVISYDVRVTPADLPSDMEETVADRLASVLSDVTAVDIETRIDSATGSLYLPVTIDQNIPIEVARFIEENSDALPGVQIVVSKRREYLQPGLYSQIIGYTGRITGPQYESMQDQGYTDQDILGQAGLEASYEQVLRGVPGQQTVALDSGGKPIPGLVTPGRDPVPGSSLYLTIDSTQQAMAQKALEWGINGAHVTQGVIIVENPQNGAILAMYSMPSYNDQDFANGISQTKFEELLTDPDQPLMNKAISGQYAPGSTFKLVTGTAGLQGCEGVPVAYQPVDSDGNPTCGDRQIDINTLFVSQPYIQFGEYKYWEWDRHGWGPINIVSAVAYSSDTFFYQLAHRVGINLLTYWMDQYGFGKSTGIDLPGEAYGIVPTNDWKRQNFGARMYEGELWQAGIGQGYDAVTPIQLINAYCALANGGNLWAPHVVGAIKDADGNMHPVQPTLLNKLPATDENLKIMREGTRAVVTTRHTLNLVDLPVAVAGKTGTAEFNVPDKFGRLPFSSWFVGYTEGNGYDSDFTKTDSQLAVLAFVYGANTQGNVATEIVKYFLWQHYGLKGYPFSIYTRGNVLTWTLHRGNYYGSGRD